MSPIPSQRLLVTATANSAALPVAALLTSMPSAQSLAVRHPARVVEPPGPPAVTAGPRIRFIYIGDDHTPDSVDRYHEQLVKAEVLLNRVFLSRALGLQPLHLGLGAQHHRQVFTRPSRVAFTSPSPLYRRWFTEHGGARSRPLPLEDLAAELVRLDGYTLEGARTTAATRAWALSKSEQDWLIARSELEPSCRPLHRDEVDELAMTLETIAGSQALPSHADRIVAANRDIARRCAAILGAIVDSYTPAPFANQVLAEAFAAAHAAHLAQMVFNATAHPTPRAGTSWFLAKRQQLRTQIALRTHQQPGVPA